MVIELNLRDAIGANEKLATVGGTLMDTSIFMYNIWSDSSSNGVAVHCNIWRLHELWVEPVSITCAAVLGNHVLSAIILENAGGIDLVPSLSC